MPSHAGDDVMQHGPADGEEDEAAAGDLLESAEACQGKGQPGDKGQDAGNEEDHDKWPG